MGPKQWEAPVAFPQRTPENRVLWVQPGGARPGAATCCRLTPAAPQLPLSTAGLARDSALLIRPQGMLGTAALTRHTQH